MTSPPARVPRAHQVFRLMVFLMNLTEPSAIRTLAPPGWKLAAPTALLLSGQSPSQCG